jgi:AraC-like DNA-binding protein
MASTTWSPDVRHPAYATRVLCEVANERGIATRDVLAGTGITPADLDDPDAVVTARDEIVAVRRLLARLPDDAGVGVEVGSRFTLTHAGLMGFAAMSCGTLRELFTIAMRYFALTMLNIDVTLFVRRYFVERDVAGIVATVSGFAYPVLEQYADRVSAEVSLDEDVLSPLLAIVPIENVSFERAHNRIHFPRDMFDAPLPQADRHTLEMCIAQCDVLMQRNDRRRGITAVVRSKLFRGTGVFPSLPEVAAELDVHPRTLRRRLAEEGTSFRALLNEARSTLSLDLLCNVGLTVEQVSKRLGYTDISTFSHAFKRWHGAPPSVFSARARRRYAECQLGCNAARSAASPRSTASVAAGTTPA